MSEMVSDEYMIWDCRSFAELRDLAVSRLTLFNARRGGEPARLTVSQWMDAENNSWLARSQALSGDIDRNYFQEMKVTFQGGKGNNHVVPVLFPLDTLPAMRKLVELRDVVGIPRSNLYVFPFTQASVGHASGWHAVNRVSVDAGVSHPERLTATTMRHRVSTLYAAMQLTEQDRQLFYKHMGHSSEINQNIYQVPLAEAEVCKVGSRLLQLDGDTRANGYFEEALDDDSIRSSSVPTDVIPISLATAETSSVGDTRQASNDESETSSNVQTEAMPDVTDEPPHKIRKSCQKRKGIVVLSLVSFDFTELIYLFLLI